MPPKLVYFIHLDADDNITISKTHVDEVAEVYGFRINDQHINPWQMFPTLPMAVQQLVITAEETGTEFTYSPEVTYIDRPM